MSGFTAAEGFTTPDDGPAFTFEALIGLRAFGLTPQGRLKSPVYVYQWTPGTNHAQHTIHAIPPHTTPAADPWAKGAVQVQHDPCPVRDCNAGFYAYHSEAYWYDHNDQPGSHITGRSPHPWINGIIAGWGRVVNGPKGFRCQKATILALALPVIPGSLAWPQYDRLGLHATFDEFEPWALERIRAQLPAVPFYESYEAMVAAIPLEPKEPA